MKKLSKNEMKEVLGGYLLPPPYGCYGAGVICTYPYPSEDQVCCPGLICRLATQYGPMLCKVDISTPGS